MAQNQQCGTGPQAGLGLQISLDLVLHFVCSMWGWSATHHIQCAGPVWNPVGQAIGLSTAWIFDTAKQEGQVSSLLLCTPLSAEFSHYAHFSLWTCSLYMNPETAAHMAIIINPIHNSKENTFLTENEIFHYIN